MLCKVTYCTGCVFANTTCTSSAGTELPGDGDCYLMQTIQSGGWPYPKDQWTLLESAVT